jgi:protein-disulfide isomerase
MNSKVTPLLTVLLVIVSFLAGSMYTRVRTLENKQGETKGEAAQVTVAQQQAQPTPIVLNADQAKEIAVNGAGEKGPKDAKVTVVEFSDYQCPYCKRYIDSTYVQLLKEYGDRILYVFHDYPLPFHPNAKPAALASRCAADQDKYWDYHEKLFATQEEWSELTGEETNQKFTTYATDMGLDSAEFSTCLTEKTHEKAVDDDLALGQKVGVGGTPSFFINGKQLVGAQPFEVFKAEIDKALK